MANIFADTEVPRWLQEDARPASGKEIGQTLGNSLATMLTSMQSNDKLGLPAEAGPLDRMQQAAFETRMNQQDPMWKAKWEVAKQGALLNQKSKWMQIEHSGKQMEVMDAGLKAKAKVEADEAEDDKAIKDVVAETGTNPQDILDTPMPALKSVKGRLNWQAMVTTAKASQDHLDAVQESIRNRQSDVTAAREFNNRLRALDTSIPEIGKQYALIKQEKDTGKQFDLLAQAEATQVTIQEANAKEAGLTVGKKTTGPTGTRTTYTAPAKTALEKAQAYRDSLDPDEDAGAWKEADAAVKKLTINPLDVLAARQVDRLAYDKQRQEDRLKIMGQAQQYKIDFSKMQQEAKAKMGAKGISEQQFIDRHINATRSSVEKNWDTEALGPVNTQKAIAEATTLLKRAYRWTNPPQQTPNSNIQPPEKLQAPNSDGKGQMANGTVDGSAPAVSKKLTYNPESDTFE